jgi:tetratricopeptide (TPR) repeat protein
MIRGRMKKRKEITEKKLRPRMVLVSCVLAVSVLASGCGSASEDTTSNYALGMQALSDGSYSDAYSYFQSAISSEGREAEGLRGQGIAQLRQGNYEVAVQCFESAQDAVVYPDQNEAFLTDCQLYEAEAYVELEQYDKALAIYDDHLDGDYAGEVYLLRGRIYLLTEKYGQAAADFQRAVEDDPSYETYLHIYDMYVDANRQADGAVFLKDALSIEPQSSDDYYQLGKICYELADYESAEQYLSKAVDADVDGAIALLGETYLEAGDVDGARSMYQQCVDEKKSESAGYNGLALCSMEDGDTDQALEYIESGLASSDTTMREALLYNEIVIYEKKGDFETAQSKMASFLEEYPSNETAQHESTYIDSRVQEMNASAPEKVIE